MEQWNGCKEGRVRHIGYYNMNSDYIQSTCSSTLYQENCADYEGASWSHRCCLSPGTILYVVFSLLIVTYCLSYHQFLIQASSYCICDSLKLELSSFGVKEAEPTSPAADVGEVASSAETVASVLVTAMASTMAIASNATLELSSSAS